MRRFLGLLVLALCQSAQALEDSTPAENLTVTPGATRVILSPLSLEESERAVHSRVLPQGLISRERMPAQGAEGKAAVVPVAPASIPELARALKHDPDLIYEYVRNNIEYYPKWGVQKGPLATLLDGQGTAFDQTALMVALLNESGIAATYELGKINLSAADVGSWLGVSTANSCAVRNLLKQGGIPVDDIGWSPSGEPGNCGTLVTARIPHLWLKATIGGAQYSFDPSYKPHTTKPGIDVVLASGYNSSSYLATGRSGATITTNYAQSINRAGLRSSLTSYANNLAAYIRANLPAGQLDDLVGGKVIVPYQGGPLRQATLPYAAATPQDLSSISPNYAPILTVRYTNNAKSVTYINDQQFASDVLSGSRLTITYDGSHRAQLWLNGVNVQTSSSPVTFDTPGTVTFTINDPTNSQLNKQFDQQIVPKSGVTNLFLISTSWGPSGRGTVELHRSTMDAARASGSASTSEAVLGSAMAILAATWITQTDRTTYIADRLAGTNTTLHHRVGIAGYNGGAYVDLPRNAWGVTSQSANSAIETTVFFNGAMHSSIFESTAVQQTTGTSAVSTVKLVDLAVSTYHLPIYDATAGNYSSSVRPNLLGCSSSQLSDFGSQTSGGARLILPKRCDLSENNWTGEGYFSIITSPLKIGALIGGDLAGGFASTSQDSAALTDATFNNSISTNESIVSTGPAWPEPIDMTKGHYLYEHDDLSVGVGTYPYSLTFKRLYSSGLRTQDGPLGKGWTHNFAISANVGSDGMQALGEDSALDAAATVVELMVSQDLLSDPTKPLDKLVMAILGQRWFGDQLVNNSVLVRNGLNGELFLLLADGTSYNPPPGNSAKLIKNADGTYSYETLHKGRIDFNSSGKAAKYSLPNGMQVNFGYTGGNLTSLSNSLGRQLTFTTTSNRLTTVAAGTPSVHYTVDSATGNLQKYTDTLAHDTTFAYDLPGRLTQIFYPSNPSSALITNAYDTLGRVKTQQNALGKVYTYYFAGSRSEEVGPDGSSNVSYVDGLGNVLERIDAVGQVTLNVYDGQSRLVKTVFPELNSIEYDYDDAQCAAQQRCTHNIKAIRQVPKPGSGLATLTSSFMYENSFNYPAHSTDALANTTDFAYTTQGDPLTVTLPPDTAGARPTVTYAYTSYSVAGFPAFSLPTGVTRTITPTQTTTTTTSYLSSNAYVPRTTVVDSAAGGLNFTSTYTYDAVGNLTNVDGPRTDVTDITTFAFDTERRLVRITDAKNKDTRFGYDADGRRTRTSAQIGTQWLVSCASYTISGKTLRTWGPAVTAADTTCPSAAAPVPVTDYAYDDLDRLQQATVNLQAQEGGNRISQIEYWADGRIKVQRRAIGTSLAQAEASYTYTSNGQLATLADANGNVTTYEYDGLDRRVKMRYPDPNLAGASSTTDFEQYTYDNNGNLTLLRTRSGQNVVLGYDNLNRIISRTYPSTPADNRVFSYDLLGRLLTANLTDGSYPISNTWDNAGRLSSSTAGGKTLTYLYDAAGNRTRITWPEATSFYVTTTYDELNRPTFIKELGATTLAQYNYDDLSRRTSVILGNSTTTSYGFDNQGMLNALSHDLAGSAQDVTFSYTRNQAQEIVTRSWTNDLYGWIGAQDTRSFTRNGLNQYTTVNGASFTYDGNGNLTGDGTATYSYDADNRLRSANFSGTAATLSWDANSRLRQTIIGGTATNLLYDGVRLVAEYDSMGTLLRRYVQAPVMDEPLVKYEASGITSKSWYYADQLGSVVALADATGTVNAVSAYGPYGEGAAAQGRFGYTGQQLLSPLALYHYKARFYSPMLGRFLQNDPRRYDSGFNLYTYVGGDPLNARDPTGLDTQYSIGVNGTAALILLGAGTSITVGLNVPDRWTDVRGYQIVGTLQLNGMVGAGAYLGFGFSANRSRTDGPLPIVSLDRGWYAEADLAYGVSAGVSVQGNLTGITGVGVGPPVPSVGEGLGAWTGAGGFASVSLATPPLPSFNQPSPASNAGGGK